ncbi:MAG TPA: hypothetical protein DHV30_06420, partial [Balneola sp.]|nr:hypothetical protein [Balneola sp.]
GGNLHQATVNLAAENIIRRAKRVKDVDPTVRSVERTFDKDGNVIITGSVTIGADVTVNADVSVGSLPNFPKHQDLIAHWNFNDF